MWVEPQPSLMLRPSGSSATTSTVGAEAPEGGRARPGTAAPLAQSSRTVRPLRSSREDRLELAQVVVEGALQLADAADGGGDGSGVERGPRSRPRRSSPSLTPSRPKNLIPLSRQGLWEAETTTPRSSPCRRTRIDAAALGRTPPRRTSPPAAATPGGEGGLEHRARLAGVAEDQHLRALGAARLGGSAAEGRRQLGGEQVADRPAHAVGAEELALRHEGLDQGRRVASSSRLGRRAIGAGSVHPSYVTKPITEDNARRRKSRLCASRTGGACGPS